MRATSPIAKLASGAAGKTEAEKTSAQAAREHESCEKLGINAEQRREGDCIAENGWKVHVVNRSSTATLEEVEVSLVDVETHESIRDLADDEVSPEGVFVEVTLRVTNRSAKPISLDGSLFALSADGTTNTPTSAVVLTSNQLGGSGMLGPHLSRTGTVIFDVARSTADAITKDGNVVMAQPSDSGGLNEPTERVAFIRTYGADNGSRGKAAGGATDGSPLTGMVVVDALETPSGRIACEMLQNSDKGGNGVRCGLIGVS